MQKPSQPTVWFVSRHAGAIEWARAQGLAVDRWVGHLDVNEVSTGDTVIGTLPVHLAAEVCTRGARYVHLVLELEAGQRGKELGADDLHSRRATLREYHVSPEEK